MYQARIDSPFGPLLLCATPKGISGLYFMDQKDCPKVPGRLQARADSLRPSSGMAGNIPLRRLRPVHSAEPAKPAAADKAKVGMELELLQEDVPDAVLDLLKRAQQELAQYFAGTRQRFSFPLDFSGTPFQTRVWQALCNVPYGELMSYGQLALMAGLTQRHGRAVGAAVGRNPLAIIVPCHRIVGSNHMLTGYTGGLARKVALLELEGFQLS